MFEFIKTKLTALIKAIEDYLFETEITGNTYCIPCTWVITGRVYVKAPNAELAKTYAKTQKINPDLEDYYCFNMNPDTEHPILCECGKCGNDYIISKYNTNPKCPHCENGGEFV